MSDSGYLEWEQKSQGRRRTWGGTEVLQYDDRHSARYPASACDTCSIDNANTATWTEAINAALRNKHYECVYNCVRTIQQKYARMYDQNNALYQLALEPYGCDAESNNALRVAIVRLFLFAGASPNGRYQHDGTTALMEFAKSQWTNDESGVLLALLEAGADVNATDFRDGNTALHHAAMACRYYVGGPCKHKSVDALLDAGANINAKNAYGQTPLFIVALVSSHGRRRQSPGDCVQTLLRRGANMYLCDDSGRFIANLDTCTRIKEILHRHRTREHDSRVVQANACDAAVDAAATAIGYESGADLLTHNQTLFFAVDHAARAAASAVLAQIPPSAPVDPQGATSAAIAAGIAVATAFVSARSHTSAAATAAAGAGAVVAHVLSVAEDTPVCSAAYH